MASVFLDADRIVLTDYLEHDSTITGTYYTDLIRKILAALQEKRRGKLHHKLLFHQDNTPEHVISNIDCHPKCWI